MLLNTYALDLPANVSWNIIKMCKVYNKLKKVQSA